MNEIIKKNKNTILNLIGLAVPFIVLMYSIRYCHESFNKTIISLIFIVWGLMAYLNVFDSGFCRKTAVRIQNQADRKQLDELITCGLIGTILSSLVFTIIAYVLFDIYISKLDLNDVHSSQLKKIPLLTPLILVDYYLRSVYEGMSNFYMSNVNKTANGSLIFMGPVLSNLIFNEPINGLVNTYAYAKVLIIAINLIYIYKYFVKIKISTLNNYLYQNKKTVLWVVVGSIIAPLLYYSDRYIIGLTQNMEIIPIYAIPQEIVLKSLVFAGAIGSALCTVLAGNQKGNNKKIIKENMVYAGIITFAILVAVNAFSEVIFNSLTGSKDFREYSFILAILSVGVFFNSLGVILIYVLQAKQKFEILARINFFETIVYVPIAYLVTVNFGIQGLAIISSLRAIADFLILYSMNKRNK